MLDYELALVDWTKATFWKGLYSRKCWTELQLQRSPPGWPPTVSVQLNDYASPEELELVMAALQRKRPFGHTALTA